MCVGIGIASKYLAASRAVTVIHIGEIMEWSEVRNVLQRFMLGPRWEIEQLHVCARMRM